MSSARDTRRDLLDAALRLLETEGPEALQARRLAAEIGTSTMAVYTYFGGMPGLIDAVVREGLTRFAAHVRQVHETDDPLADLIGGGLAYGEFALANPQLYQLMFGLARGPRLRGAAAQLDASSTWRRAEGADAFSVLLTAVERVIDSGEMRPQDPRVAAVQILSVTHGYLMLAIGGFIEEDLREAMTPLAVNLMVGLGADRDSTERSLALAERISAQAAAGEAAAG